MMRAVVVECGCLQRDPLARGLLVTHMAGSGTERSERKSPDLKTSTSRLGGPASTPFSYGCQGDHSKKVWSEARNAMELAVSVLTKPH